MTDIDEDLKRDIQSRIVDALERFMRGPAVPVTAMLVHPSADPEKVEREIRRNIADGRWTVR